MSRIFRSYTFPPAGCRKINNFWEEKYEVLKDVEVDDVLAGERAKVGKRRIRLWNRKLQTRKEYWKFVSELSERENCIVDYNSVGWERNREVRVAECESTPTMSAKLQRRTVITKAELEGRTGQCIIKRIFFFRGNK